MPKDLPGLYWDEERKRYFPTSSRPKELPQPPATIASTHQASVAKLKTSGSSGSDNRRRWPPLHAQTVALSTECYTKRLRDSHDILSFHYAGTSRLTRFRIPTLGHIQTFCSTQINDRTWRFIGDDQGWLYSDKETIQEDRGGVHYWSSDLNLQPSSPISSISVSGPRCVSTCLGPGKIAVQDLTSPERMFLLNINGVNDIRASDLKGRSLVLGASKKAIYISDIDASHSPQYLHTKSDVFSVIQDRTLVLTGARNGTVERFDIRTAKQHSQKLFDMRFSLRAAPRSSVLHIHLVREHEILLSHLNGDLLAFDVRFPSPAPLTVFAGHVNCDIPNLGIAVDAAQDFLFAAGQDCRVRGWSLRTGLPLPLPTPAAAMGSNTPYLYSSSASPAHSNLTTDSRTNTNTHTNANTNPFLTTFPSPVVALQVTDEVGEAGRTLWAGAGRDLYAFHLGQRMMGV